MFFGQAATEQFLVIFPTKTPPSGATILISPTRNHNPKVYVLTHTTFSNDFKSATLFNSMWSHVRHYLQPVFHFWTIVVPFLAFSVFGLISFFLVVTVSFSLSLLGSAENFFQCFEVKTTLQVLALQRDGSAVSVKKQKSAFPPNFVHSLDGSHMMMTALACSNAGLCFAGVHDSFWTHACDVDKMNQILREKFVELYNKPILENLLEGFQTTYPGLTFPPMPNRGDFDLQMVLDSPYFFN